ncbi:MAG: Bax protein, partial [Candidatus Krumholzibacteriia bacterium]
KLRQLRAQMRAIGAKPSAAKLATGLGRYSQRGDAYVKELQAMIRVNSKVIDQVRVSGTPEGTI